MPRDKVLLKIYCQYALPFYLKLRSSRLFFQRYKYIYIYIIFVESGWFELGLPICIRRYEIVANEIRIDKRKANGDKEWKKNRIDIVSVKEIDVQPLNRASWLDASTV